MTPLSIIKRFLRGFRKTLIYAGDPVKVYLHIEVVELRKELEWANCELEKTKDMLEEEGHRDIYHGI